MTASGIIGANIEKVWAAVRSFDFPSKLLSSVKSCELLDGAGATSVGAVRKLTWEHGEWKQQRLLELSDLHYTVSWELVASEPASETTATISTIRLARITEDNTTLLTWSTDFSSDVNPKLVGFEQKAYHENIREIRKAITGK